MNILPSEQYTQAVVASETDYMVDRMRAIADRPGNPEGIRIEQFGQAVCLYSRTMPWGAFNTVKGITADDREHLDEIIAFYRALDRKVQFEIVPSLDNHELLRELAERGFYQSGFHASMAIGLDREAVKPEPEALEVRIEAIGADDFDAYAAIHCRGTGLSDDGIPHVAANNRVLSGRPGWTHYIAYVNDAPAAVAVLYANRPAASLTFAATLPEFRSRGLQQQLLRRRIADAAVTGCELVVSQCAYLSQSHRNMERVGMKLAYVRSTWTQL